MKIKTLILFLIITFSSCTRNKSEENLYGLWFGLEKNNLLQISTDSLTLFFPYPQKVLWKANKHEIELDYSPNSNDTEKVILKYEIHNDTLITDYHGIIKTYLKANDFVDFLNKKYDIKFSLPKNEKLKTLQSGNQDYGMNIFVGKLNEKTIIRTEQSKDLNRINEEASVFVNEFGILDIRKFHYRVFADKNISQTELKNIYTKLRKTKIKKIYRIYEYNDEHSNFKFEYIKEN